MVPAAGSARVTGGFAPSAADVSALPGVVARGESVCWVMI